MQDHVSNSTCRGPNTALYCSGTVRLGKAKAKPRRARDLITHGPAHRGANGAAMPTDEDDQDGLLFFNHPERGDYPAA